MCSSKRADIFNARKQSLGQRHVFTGVCLSTRRGYLVLGSGCVCASGSGGVPLGPGGVHTPPGHTHPVDTPPHTCTLP